MDSRCADLGFSCNEFESLFYFAGFIQLHEFESLFYFVSDMRPCQYKDGNVTFREPVPEIRNYHDNFSDSWYSSLFIESEWRCVSFGNELGYFQTPTFFSTRRSQRG